MNQKNLIPYLLSQESKLNEVAKNVLEKKYNSSEAFWKIQSERNPTKFVDSVLLKNCIY